MPQLSLKTTCIEWRHVIKNAIWRDCDVNKFSIKSRGTPGFDSNQWQCVGCTWGSVSWYDLKCQNEWKNYKFDWTHLQNNKCGPCMPPYCDVLKDKAVGCYQRLETSGHCMGHSACKGIHTDDETVQCAYRVIVIFDRTDHSAFKFRDSFD